MKYLNTLLLLVIAIALGANFYLDNKRDKAFKTKIDSLSAIAATAITKDKEASPFDNQSPDPMMSPHKAPVVDITSISFEHTAHDFGRVESGPTYTAVYKFKNTGKADLFISGADASCGCTVPTWSREAIKPGETSEITVNFDSKGRSGEQLKTVTVTSNTEPNKNVLTLHTLLYLKTK